LKVENDFYLPLSAPPDFDDALYLRQNADVLALVKEGALTGGFHHYFYYGQHEGRLRTRKS
jgi:hypothetical protein